MAVTVRSIGWLTPEGYGMVRTGVSRTLDPGEDVRSLAKGGVLPRPFKNFGRLDEVSQLTTCAVALALKDAGIDPGPQAQADIGIVATCDAGSLASDLAFFRDYLDNGRTLSRGNLFVYTLPSSPLGEAAIYFGLTGPLLFVTAAESPLAALLEEAGRMLESGETGALLAGQVAGGEAFYFLLGCGEAGDSLCDLAEARAVVASAGSSAEIVGRFSSMMTSRV